MSEIPPDQRDWMTRAELTKLKSMREARQMTMFRLATCASCREPIVSSFKFCSKVCSDRSTHMVKIKELWQVDPDALIGLMCNIETIDGSVRRGARISGVRSRTIKVNGGDDEWMVPFAIELNDDGGDYIPIDHLSAIDLWDSDA